MSEARRLRLVMVHGGNPGTPALCERAGWRYGIQQGYTAYTAPYMLDYTGGDWAAYLTLLEAHRPHMAVVADFRQPSERETVVHRMYQVAALGTRPITVAKWRGAVAAVPCEISGVRTIVGVSVPTRYMNDGCIPSPDELNGHDLHLLGGHPDQWARLIALYAPVATVYSADGNVLYREARRGKLWSRYGGYRDLRGQGYGTDAIAVASMRNTRRFLGTVAAGGIDVRRSYRVQQCDIQAGLLAADVPLW